MKDLTRVKNFMLIWFSVKKVQATQQVILKGQWMLSVGSSFLLTGSLGQEPPSCVSVV